MSDDQTPPPSDQPPADPPVASTPAAPVKAVRKAPAKSAAKAPAKRTPARKSPVKKVGTPTPQPAAEAPVVMPADVEPADAAPAEADSGGPAEPAPAPAEPAAPAAPAEPAAPAAVLPAEPVVEPAAPAAAPPTSDVARPAPAEAVPASSAVPAATPPAAAASADSGDDLPAPLASVAPADPAGADVPPSSHDEDPDEPRKGLPLWQESLLLVGVALVLAIVIKAFFVQAFYIPSESMEPGLVDNDRILVEKPSYWTGTPQRGDVIVFKDPGHWLVGDEDAGPKNVVAKALAKVGLFPSGGHLVKRVIGVAGDTITCCDATTGEISVNGHPLDETAYVNQEKGMDCFGPQTGDCNWTAGPVPKGELFVMGDNRLHSGDSSAHLCTSDETDCTDNPYVKVSLVTGKVFNLVWPLSHFKFFHRPHDFAGIPDPQ